MAHITYLEAVVLGAVQGVSELFPVSSLGHAILLPAVIGGSWARDLNVTAPHSPYLAFIVALHVATALALIVFYRRDWVALVRGFVGSVRRRRIDTAEARLVWLLILATVPVAVVGLAFDHLLRAALGSPIPTAAFLVVNGFLLIAVHFVTRSGSGRHGVEDTPDHGDGRESVVVDPHIARLTPLRAVAVGAAQIAALFPGISRSGSTIIAGRLAGLPNRSAARFAFLLATPAILAAGVLEIPTLLTRADRPVLGPVAAGSVVAFVAALAAVSFLDRYFARRSVWPFGVYCIVAGVGALLLLTA
ncbi:undecaprenyl-diphosphate phosphatase [Amnibacterium kyonggiense]